MNWFEGMPVLGALPPDEAAGRLRAVGEGALANTIEDTLEDDRRESYGGRDFWSRLRSPRAWQHTAHAFGYLTPAPHGDDLLPLSYAGNMPADDALKGARIKVTLDRLYAADYPGGGTHEVLFAFAAQHHATDATEDLNFTLTAQVHEGQHAAVVGYPVFRGLNVGQDGAAFRCRTVNVKNTDDESLLAFLGSDVFKRGLELAATAQPAIGPLSEMAIGLARTLAGHKKNVSVQDFYLGLDFSNIPTRASLAEGTYFAVQIPEGLMPVWDWGEWAYNPNSGLVVKADDPAQPMGYNYVAFSVSRHEV